MAGNITFMFDVLITSIPQMRAGRVRALAVTSAKRSPYVPEVPTMDESGVRGLQRSGQRPVVRHRRAGRHPQADRAEAQREADRGAARARHAPADPDPGLRPLDQHAGGIHRGGHGPTARNGARSCAPPARESTDVRRAAQHAARAEGVPDSRGLNLFDADPSYRGLLELHLDAKLCAHLLPHFTQLGAMAGAELDELALEADKNASGTSRVADAFRKAHFIQKTRRSRLRQVRPRRHVAPRRRAGLARSRCRRPPSTR